MQRRLLKAERKAGFVATVSSHALIRLEPILTSFAQLGTKFQHMSSASRVPPSRCRTTGARCVGARFQRRRTGEFGSGANSNRGAKLGLGVHVREAAAHGREKVSQDGLSGGDKILAMWGRATRGLTVTARHRALAWAEFADQRERAHCTKPDAVVQASYFGGAAESSPARSSSGNRLAPKRPSCRK